MEIEGKLIKILPLESGESKNGTWRKQPFLFQTEGQYPKTICFMIWGNQIDNNPLEENSRVKVFFDVESRVFNGRWFTDAKAFKVQKLDAPTDIPQNQDDKESVFSDIPDEPTDDLPF